MASISTLSQSSGAQNPQSQSATSRVNSSIGSTLNTDGSSVAAAGGGGRGACVCDFVVADEVEVDEDELVGRAGGAGGGGGGGGGFIANESDGELLEVVLGRLSCLAPSLAGCSCVGVGVGVESVGVEK